MPSRILPRLNVPPLTKTLPLETSVPTATRYTVALTATEVPVNPTVPNPSPSCPMEFSVKVSVPLSRPAFKVLPAYPTFNVLLLPPLKVALPPLNVNPLLGDELTPNKSV